MKGVTLRLVVRVVKVDWYERRMGRKEGGGSFEKLICNRINSRCSFVSFACYDRLFYYAVYTITQLGYTMHPML